MKKLLLVAVAAAISISSFSQLNMTFLDSLDLYTTHGNNDLSDVWGYADGTGEEYAIVGLRNGTSICHVSSAGIITEVFWEPGMNSIWRDMKVWNDHAFITTEALNGLLVIDLSTLAGSTPVALGTSYYNGPSGDQWESAHNLFIDENGVCYIFGANRDNGGCIMLDVTDPTNIVELGAVEDYYVHDGVCKNDTLFLAHINDGFMTVWDVTNKSAPVQLGNSPTPGFFSHNIWFSDDLDYVYTTDEISNGYIGEYDVSDPSNIIELDRIQSSPGMDVIPHNAHFFDDYIITSYYRDGVTIHDVSNKGNMIEVGNFDTSPAFSGDGFNGCWGAYPWLPSGKILATDIENGLFVLGATYTRACYLEGTVTDISTTGPINGVQIELVSTSVVDASNIGGDYATGYNAAGTYDVIFSHPSYFPDTAFSVVLTNGVVTVQDMALIPIVPVDISGNVSELVGGADVGGAIIEVDNDDFNYTATADGSGNWTITNVIPGDYTVTVGLWGYHTACASFTFNLTSTTADMQLETGYADDFGLDLGWVETSTASTGIFERADPIEITGGGGDLHVPEDDLTGDCRGLCYTTGNGASSAGADDVDDGDTQITSPSMDLTTYVNPYLNFSRFFNNSGGGGGSTRNDSLTVILNDGSTDYILDYFTEDDNDVAWNAESYRIKNFAALTSNMTITFHTEDVGAGHLVEASIDGFLISDSLATAVYPAPINARAVSIFPNPTMGVITLQALNQTIRKVEITDLSGKLILSESINDLQKVVFTLPENSGVYIVRTTMVDGSSDISRVVRN